MSFYLFLAEVSKRKGKKKEKRSNTEFLVCSTTSYNYLYIYTHVYIYSVSSKGEKVEGVRTDLSLDLYVGIRFPVMSLAGERRRVVLYFCVVALLIVPMSEIWVCREYHCKAAAARLLPGEDGATWKVKQIDGGDDDDHQHHKKSSEEEFFQRFYNNNGRDLNFNLTEKGFEETKRRVPSCPDPLHN